LPISIVLLFNCSHCASAEWDRGCQSGGHLSSNSRSLSDERERLR
jgi:hypothetical protein